MDKIIGIGNALVDVLMQIPDDSVLTQLNLPRGGMTLIDEARLAELEGLTASLQSVRATGGSAGNAMLALARLGARPGFIGRVADDEMGRFLHANCLNVGIEPRLIAAPGRTGVANTFITPDGERTFATHLGVAAGLSAADITRHLFRGYQLLHIEGYLVQDHNLIETVARMAHEAGLRTSIDLASYNIVAQERPFFRSLVERYIDIVFANAEESVAFTGGKSPREALDEMAGMCELVVVKLGAEGSCARRGTEAAQVPPAPTTVVDTTAAGDFFAGGFLHALTCGAALEQCLRAGALLSAEVIRVVGTQVTDGQWSEIRLNLARILR